jgi:hypothetical protein
MKLSVGSGTTDAHLIAGVYEETSVASAPFNARLSAAQISALAASLRAASRAALPADRIAIALCAACECWRDRNYPLRHETIGAIAAAWGWSEALLDESIDALMAPVTRLALEQFARQVPRQNDLVGLIMPGNVPAAGIHELVAALLSGCTLMVKTATAEPFFFPRFMRTLREADAQVGARIAVLNWSRERTDLTSALRTNCDWIAAFGNDDTVAQLASKEDPAALGGDVPGRLRAGFGSRVSGALVAAEVAARPTAIRVANALARDISLFEQQGCLSPHHVFVESTDPAVASGFARELAAALERFAIHAPPPLRYGLEAAAAVRRVRESARWRAIGGSAVALVEGGGFGWTLVSDDEAVFTFSPGYRTVTLSAVANPAALQQRLWPVAGRIEAFAIAAPEARRESLRAFLAAMGVCYLCEPGAMQSPPLDWSHGGGAFLRALATSR